MDAPTVAPSLTSPAVMASLLSFVLSVGAAILAINLYALLRTGQMGASWRVLIIASVLFTLLQAVKFAELVLPTASGWHLSAIIEVIFILALAYAFWLQRRVFMETHAQRHGLEKSEIEDDEEEEPAAVSAYERYS